MADLNNSINTQWNAGFTYEQMQQYNMYYGGYQGSYGYYQYNHNTPEYH